MEVLYCACYGGFHLSDSAKVQIKQWGYDEEKDPFVFYDRDSKLRSDPKVVQLVKSMGQEATYGYCYLAIASFPAKYKEHLYITEFDGLEAVHIKYQSYIASLVKDIDVATATREQLAQTMAEVQACATDAIRVTE